MNPLDLEKQKEEESVVPDEEVAPPMPCGDGCDGCETCTSDDENPPETEQPKEELPPPPPPPPPPEAKQMTEEQQAELEKGEEILQGLTIELTRSGEVKRKFYGDSQNVTLMLGLCKILTMEVEQRQRLQRGFMPSAEMTAMAGMAQAMQNIGAVLVQIQGAMGSMNQMIQAGFNELRPVESAVDAKSKQE